MFLSIMNAICSGVSNLTEKFVVLQVLSYLIP